MLYLLLAFAGFLIWMWENGRLKQARLRIQALEEQTQRIPELESLLYDKTEEIHALNLKFQVSEEKLATCYRYAGAAETHLCQPLQ